MALIASVLVVAGASTTASAAGAPELTVSGTVPFTESGPAVVLAPGLTLTGPAGETIDKATVSIGAGFSSTQDRLGIDGQGGTSGTVVGLGWSYNTTTGVLTLSGVAPLATYEDALQQVTYVNVGASPSTTDRGVDFVVGGGLYFEDTQHFYEFVPTSTSWPAAKAAAEARSLYGLQGYLVTVTSAGENGFVTGKLQGTGWLGASDAGHDKRWYWETGPEAGTWFFTQRPGAGGGCGIGAAPVQPGSHYSSWAGNEPNDYSNGCPTREDYGHFYTNGLWNDLPATAGVAGYVVEYGGLPGDPVVSLTGQVTVEIQLVPNEAPTVEAGTDQSADEGDVVSLDPSTFTDPDATDTHTATVDWGDGTPAGAGAVSAGGNVDGSHVYADNGAYTVTVCVEDNEGAAACDTLTVTVANVAPVVDAGADQTADEDVEVSLDPSTFTDVGSADTHTATVDWGDGTALETGTVASGGGGAVLFGVTGDGAAVPETLYTIDATTAATTLAIPLGNGDGGEEIAFNSDTGLLLHASGNAPILETIDPATLAISPLPLTGDPVFRQIRALVYDPTVGVFLAGGNSFGSSWHTITNNGFATRVGSMDHYPGGLAFSGGVLYSVHRCCTTNTLRTLNPATGATLTSTPITGVPDDIWTALAAHPTTGVLYGVQKSSRNLITIDPSGAATVIGSLGDRFAGLAWAGSGGGTVDGSHTYADDGVFTVEVCVTDDDGGVGCDTLTMTINAVNDPPVVDAGGPYSGNEGVAIGLSGATASDPDGDPLTLLWTVDSAACSFSDTSALNPDLTCDDDGSYTVTLSVDDGTDPPVTSDATVTVNNVDPAVAADNATVSTDEGTAAGNSGTYSDVAADTVTLSADIGNLTDNGDGTWDWDNPAPDGPDSYTVTITADDDDGGTGTATFDVTVDNVAPTVEAGADQSVDEGDVVSLDPSTFTDPGAADTHTATVDWGDGTAVEAATVTPGNVDGSHVYADDGTYTVEVCVEDNDGADGCDTLTVTVANVAPVVDAGADQTTNEGTSISLDPADFSDAGTADTHTATIDWGDGSALATGTVSETPTGPPGSTTPAGGSVSGSHAYDENGTYTVTVCVTDDESAETCDTLTITVQNVAPVLANIVGDSIDESGTATVSGDIVDPGVLDTFTLEIDWGEGTPQTFTYPAGTTSFSETHQYLDDNPSGTSSDDYTVALKVTDDDLGEGTGSATVTVQNLNPVASVDNATSSVQYSDPIMATTFTSTDVAGDPLSMATSWSSDGVTFAAGLPDLLSASATSCTADTGANTNTCETTVSGIADVAPGTYTVRVTTTDDDGGSSSTDTVITVLQEDARSFYIGPLLVSTPSANNGSADVELRATIQDITAATGDAATDPDAGDIRNATVEFRDDTGAVLCTASSVDLVIAGDESVGTASCTWTANIGNADAASFDIRIVVDGHYIDTSDNEVVVTVAKPLDNFITGGGYLVATDSAGVYSAGVGERVNYGFNVKFNKKGKNLKGQVNIIIRGADGHKYKIKSNALQSLGVILGPNGEEPHYAEFESKANLKDLTDDIGVGGNLTLQMQMHDNGEPGENDTIGFSLWNSSGTLLFSSNWTGVQTAEQTITGGNLQVH